MGFNSGFKGLMGPYDSYLVWSEFAGDES